MLHVCVKAPLPLAVSKSYTDVASYLLQHGSNPNKVDRFGTSALHYAARTNSVVIMKELLSVGANPNILDQGNNSRTQILAHLYVYIKN
jgi:ankyrin repeat protein